MILFNPKVPTEELNRDTPSYTGMAAALAEALKQRRMHFTEKRTSPDTQETTCMFVLWYFLLCDVICIIYRKVERLGRVTLLRVGVTLVTVVMATIGPV